MSIISLGSGDSRWLVRGNQSVRVDHNLLEKWVEEKHKDNDDSANEGLTPEPVVSMLRQRKGISALPEFDSKKESQSSPRAPTSSIKHLYVLQWSTFRFVPEPF